MKKYILKLLSLFMGFMIFTACQKNHNIIEESKTDITVPGIVDEYDVHGTGYEYDVPFYLADLFCLEIEGEINDAHTLFDQIPSNKISRRFHSGEDLQVKDSFKMIKDDQFLYIKLFYEKLPQLNNLSRSKQHVILLQEAQKNGSILVTKVVYEQEWSVSIDIKGASSGTIPSVTSQIHESDTGYDSLVKIPLDQLNLNLKQLQMNVMRIDWGANPVTSYFPIANSYFFDYADNRIGLTLLLSGQGRMIDVQYTKEPTDFVIKQSKIRLHCIGTNKQQIIVEGTYSDYSLSWQSPQGNRTYLPSDLTRTNGKDVLTFDNPPILEEGIYRIRLGNKDNTVLYVEKKAFIEAANNNITIDEVEKEDVDISSFSDKAKLLLEIVPPYPGIMNIPDPKDTSLHPSDLYSYSISDPHHIKSKKTGDLYPNVNYPEKEVFRVDNKNETIVEYPYYKDEDGVIFFFTPALWAYQKKYINSELPDIAKTDPVGTAHILALICENYDNYVPALDHYYTFYPVSKMAGSPYPYYGGLWTNWFYSDLNFVANIAEAYALVNKTNALDKIGAETRRDLHTQILSMIKDTVDFSDSYGIQDSNMDPTQWRGLIRIGKALQQPDYIHYALERIDSFVKNYYLFDGFWKEVTMSYHNQTTSGLISVFSLLSKYSDPEGYVYPGTGERVDHFRFLDRYPFLETSHSLSGLLAYPNGKHLPIQDTHASGQGTRTKEAFENIIMSASGIARLTGNPDVVKVTGTQAVLTYVPKYGHIHRDTLNMNLFGYGVELLPDLGYTHTRNRSWTASTLAHNTVVVNQRNSNGTHVGNTLRYVPSENSVGIMRAFDPNAYSEANVYDREVIYVPGENDTPEGYILDLFRVLGGDRHEYTLNMCADYDYELTTDITWQKKSETMLPEGVPCVKPTAQNDSGSASGHYTAYMFVEDVQWAELKDQPFQIHYTVSEAGTYTNVGLNILGASTTGHMSLGSAPSMRATRMSTLNDSNDQCDDYLMDKMVLRREGSNLSSCFVTVMEPYSAKYQGKIKSVQRLQVEGLHEFDVVVKVVADEFTDYIFSAFREDMDVTVDQIEFKGQFGYIRLQNKKAVLMQTLNADVLSYDNTTISENRSLPGVVTDVLNKSEGDAWNGFVTNVKPDEELIGQYIIVKHPDQTYTGYQITGIIEKDGSFVIDIGNAEPGFAFIGDQHTKMIFYPHTERKGVIEFTIDHSKKYTIKN